MAKVIFNLDGKETMVECSRQETMKEIIQRFANKAFKDLNNYIFIYGGDNIKPNLTFESQANHEDKKRLQMNVLVYEKDNIVNNKHSIEETEINNLNEKISQILSKYLEDRNYLENKIINWMDAILQDCEQLFMKYKDYKTFINVIIIDKNKSQSHRGGNYNRRSSNTFKVAYQSNTIKSTVYISMFYKKINRNKYNLSEALKSIEKQFLNLAEGRSLKVFKEKYYETFKNNVKVENYIPYIFLYISKNEEIYSKRIIIVNGDKTENILSKIVKLKEFSLYILLANA